MAYWKAYNDFYQPYRAYRTYPPPSVAGLGQAEDKTIIHRGAGEFVFAVIAGAVAGILAHTYADIYLGKSQRARVKMGGT